jgi:hypothetical protein
MRTAQPNATIPRRAPAIRLHRPDLLDARHMMYEAANAQTATIARRFKSPSTTVRLPYSVGNLP